MGWKNVKEHYRIGHIVRVTEKGICIGSPLCHDLIVIDKWRKTVTASSLGVHGNDDLERYWTELHADLDKLWELIEKPDEFAASITVYTWEAGEILEMQCEKIGYPNVTHSGQMMFENTFSADRKVVIGWAIRDAEAASKLFRRRIFEVEQDLARLLKDLGDHQDYASKFRSELYVSLITEMEKAA